MQKFDARRRIEHCLTDEQRDLLDRLMAAPTTADRSCGTT